MGRMAADDPRQRPLRRPAGLRHGGARYSTRAIGGCMVGGVRVKGRTMAYGRAVVAEPTGLSARAVDSARGGPGPVAGRSTGGGRAASPPGPYGGRSRGADGANPP